ncbi:hypothetical protein AB0L44_15115 [Nonomuraea wenchangensis]|uniref:hypothetical protein n=1 Tax=Nonomuraea wenchangensis TaxID=568860 RepID=UPI00342B21AE
MTVTGPAALVNTSGAHFKTLTRSILPFVAEPEEDDAPALTTHPHIEAVNNELLLIGADRRTLGAVRQPLTAASARNSPPACTGPPTGSPAISMKIRAVDDLCQPLREAEQAGPSDGRQIELASGQDHVPEPSAPADEDDKDGEDES